MIDLQKVFAAADAERQRCKGLTGWVTTARVGRAISEEIRRQYDKQKEGE